ncbi:MULTISPECIES: hypothetical protein [Actinomycetes]|uniref:hypothetical protein n=1 Tax=Actinomycetes TaxID=1760 RepID=UPI00342A3B6B
MSDETVKCPVPWIHPEDLVRDDDPGMGLTPAEIREVQDVLGEALVEQTQRLLADMRSRAEILHPIPADPGEYSTWRLGLSSSQGVHLMSLEAERAVYSRLCRASARGDWATILFAFTKAPGGGQELPGGTAVQPIRDALQARRTALRQQTAKRLGCTCS